MKNAYIERENTRSQKLPKTAGTKDTAMNIRNNSPNYSISGLLHGQTKLIFLYFIQRLLEIDS